MFSFPEKPKTRAINFDDTKLAAQFQIPTKFSLALALFKDFTYQSLQREPCPCFYRHQPTPDRCYPNPPVCEVLTNPR